MKTLFFSFFLFCLPALGFSQGDNAQFDHKIEENVDGNKILDNMERRFGLQLLLGFNAAQIDGDGMEGFHKFALNGGLRTLIIWSPKVSTSIDLLYSQKGAQRTILDNPFLSRIDMDYVEVPLMLQYRDWRFQFGAGVSYARLLNFKVLDLDHNDITRAYSPKVDALNWTVGATLFFNKKWGLNLMYQRSILPLLDNNTWVGFHWTARAVYQL